MSFFTDISSEMILPILPLFLVQSLGVGEVSIGLIEGVANATASLLKVISGWFSDRIGKRKLFVLAGYGLSNGIKPVLALVHNWSQVLGIRFFDRVGKGIRTAPRDALIADSSREEYRGRSFGFHRAMDTAGAVMGSLIAFGILSLKTDAFRTVFAFSAVPGLAAVLILLFFLREPLRKPERVFQSVDVARKELGRGFSLYLVLVVLMTFGEVGYAFALLRAHGVGISVRMIPLIYLMYNVVYTLCAMPVGILSDRWGRISVLKIGVLVNTVLAVGMAIVEVPGQMIALFIIYGFVSAVYETVPRALASDLSPKSMRGTGLGFYHTVVGVTALPASLVFGFLWQQVHVRAAFAFSGGISVLAFLLMVIWL